MRPRAGRKIPLGRRNEHRAKPIYPPCDSRPASGSDLTATLNEHTNLVSPPLQHMAWSALMCRYFILYIPRGNTSAKTCRHHRHDAIHSWRMHGWYAHSTFRMLLIYFFVLQHLHLACNSRKGGTQGDERSFVFIELNVERRRSKQYSCSVLVLSHTEGILYIRTSLF